MKTVRDLYRKLNNDSLIPEIEGEICFTPEQMIWFGEQVVKLFTIPVSGSYYLLKAGDYIQSGDEYREEDGSWHKTGQIDKKYNPSKHYKHRRLK
jgi:hypothetical protein